MRLWWVTLAVAGMIVTCMPPSAAVADELRSALDASLAAEDLPQLVSIIRNHKDPGDQAEITDWLKEKVDTGQTPDSFVTVMTQLSLARKNVDDALLYFSYYNALISIDSGECSDPTSGGSLLEASMFLGAWTQSPNITLEQKQAAVDHAIKLEAATSSARKRDQSLCTAGLTAYAKALHIPTSNSAQAEHHGAQEAQQELLKSSLYADDPLWRKRRAETLPQIPTLLLIMMGIQKPH